MAFSKPDRRQLHFPTAVELQLPVQFLDELFVFSDRLGVEQRRFTEDGASRFSRA